MEREREIDAIADRLLEARRNRRQIAPLTSAPGGLSLDDAYRVTAHIRKMREAAGETVIGRKIGFTNRTIWDEYDVHAPIWGYMYDTTFHDGSSRQEAVLLGSFCEPRIEPEIIFGFDRAPAPEMSESQLFECIGWLAHGFEIVDSMFADWKFQAADTVAAFGLHGIYLCGPRISLTSGNREALFDGLSGFSIDLLCNGRIADSGHSSNVLDGPLTALHHAVGVIASDPANPPVKAGEVVTTGTLTRALPIRPGERWQTRIDGLPLPPMDVTFG